ncbi:MAG TPA: AbrB/MazE/SpoVT family DNA-binding domain-containing protein [Nitrososphaerales archaeon]|nr:AbrB/MazE/SpoVT family DNA-binding domain-containing protein [Nitrososphaerales archaeon]
MGETVRKVTVLGSTSYVVTIPKQVADLLGITKGTLVTMELQGKGILIQKKEAEAPP